MKAAVINARGQAPQFQEFPEPLAAEGEAIVEMRAAGLHPIVKSLARGEHYASGGQLPAIAGIDGVGELNGRLVYCFSARRPYGTMAEQTVVNPEKCLLLPEGLDPMQAAAIANPGISAWLSLKLRAGLVARENVLILGATGVAGQLAIQAARYLGAGKVIAAGRNLAALQSQPVDAVISLTDPEEAISEAFAAHLRDEGIDVGFGSHRRLGRAGKRRAHHARHGQSARRGQNVRNARRRLNQRPVGGRASRAAPGERLCGRA